MEGIVVMRIVVLSIVLSLLLFSKELVLSDTQANTIAKKVWQNEGAGLDRYLIHWNEGEDFASLGIGHFIWFPKGHTERFREVFPMFIAYLEKEGVAMPHWLNSNTPFPWQTKKAFYRAKGAKTERYRELFAFLKHTQAYQARFMANRLQNALPQMLETLESKAKRQLITERFNQLLYTSSGQVSQQGLYILLDYTNFKGEGTLKSERYKGQGWGLLQVLAHMNPKEPNVYKAFALSAKAMLSRRIKNSPPARGEERWRLGWNKRLDTYWK
jgi:hypothetical protein